MIRGKRLQEISCVEDFARSGNADSLATPAENPLDCFDDERRSNRVNVLPLRRGAAFFASRAGDHSIRKICAERPLSSTAVGADVSGLRRSLSGARLM
jgi:hypothetical protein